MANDDAIIDKTSAKQSVTNNKAVTWWHWHRRLYNWVVHWADTRYGIIALIVLALTEPVCIPIPADVLVIGLCLGKPKRSLRYGLTCAFFSVPRRNNCLFPWSGYRSGTNCGFVRQHRHWRKSSARSRSLHKIRFLGHCNFCLNTGALYDFQLGRRDGGGFSAEIRNDKHRIPYDEIWRGVAAILFPR